MAIGRPKKILSLSDDERETLERYTRRPKTAQALALRARIVLLVERLFADLTHRRIRRSSFASVKNLRRAIHEYLDVRNAAPKPFRWTKPADLILRKVAEHCERTLGTGH